MPPFPTTPSSMAPRAPLFEQDEGPIDSFDNNLNKILKL
jgi:hypothetical protein